MKKAKLQRLVHQYFNDTISRADCIELLEYLNNSNPDEIADIIDTELINFTKGPQFKGSQSADVLSRIKSDPRFTQPPAAEETYPAVVKFYRRGWVQIAAALLVFGTAALIVFNKGILNQTKKSTINQQSAAIVPGSNKAILTLAGGKTIVLKNAANGLLAQTVAGNVLKTNNG